jgi:MFS family permease
VCGLGCLAGPTIGGILYDIPKKFEPNSDAIWGNQLCFRLPFYVVGFFCFVVTVFVFFRFGNVQAKDGDVSAPISSVLTYKRLLSLIAIALNGTVVATLDPTLSNKLFSAPFEYDADKVGLLFTVSSVLYIIASMPVGWLMDKSSTYGPQLKSKVCKATQGLGFIMLAICFTMLGPWRVGAASLDKLFDNVPSIWIAMMFKGTVRVFRQEFTLEDAI